jgi:hypothetical protein
VVGSQRNNDRIACAPCGEQRAGRYRRGRIAPNGFENDVRLGVNFAELLSHQEAILRIRNHDWAPE